MHHALLVTMGEEPAVGCEGEPGDLGQLVGEHRLPSGLPRQIIQPAGVGPERETGPANGKASHR